MLFLSGVQTRTVSLKNIETVQKAKDITGLIIGGKGFYFTDESLQQYRELFSFFVSVPYPVLGICFGHQVLGLVHGGAVMCGEYIKIRTTLRYLKQDELLKGIPSDAQFKESHHDFVSVPESFFLIADSSTCSNEIMKHETKPLYGVQFHPERSGKWGRRLLLNFARLTSAGTSARSSV